MSIGDSFASFLDALEDAGDVAAGTGEPGGLADSFADDLFAEHEAAASSGDPTAQEEAPSPKCADLEGQPAGTVPKRRNKRRSAVIQQVLEEAALERREEQAALPISEKRRQAAKARWDKQAGETKPESACDSQQLVTPFHLEDIKSVSPFNLESKTLDSILDVMGKPIDREHRDYKRELDVFNHMAHMVSKSATAEAAGYSRRTLTRKTRLISAILVLVRRYNNLMGIQKVQNFMLAQSNDTEPLAFIQKEKFDEVSFLLRLTEEAAKRHEDGTLDDQQKETVVAKLLQLQLTYYCVWRVDETHVHLKLRQPTVLQAIECNTAEAIKAGLLRMIGDLEFARQTFPLCARMPITDEAAAITKANYSLLESLPWLKCVPFICKLHKKNKTAKMQLSVYALDKSGVVNTCLALQYGGAFRRFKRTLKGLIKQRLVCRPWGEHGPGAEATARNELVLAEYLNAVEDTSLSGRGSSVRMGRVVARRVLLNGNLESAEVEHYERGCCPKGPKQTLRRINKHVINTMQRPRPWNTDKWLGAGPGHQFVGEWLNTHGLLPDAFEIAFGSGQKGGEEGGASEGFASSASVPARASAASTLEEEDDIAGVADLEGFDAESLASAAIADCTGDGAAIAVFKEVVAEDSGFKRSHTYRLNALRWLKTKPQGRFACMKRLQDVQQHDCASLMKQVGDKWNRKEALSRSKGNDPNYRVVDAAHGKYTTPALVEYGRLVRDDSGWKCLPGHQYSHHLANQAYRGAAISSATTYQLEQVREETYPYLPARLVGASGAQMFILADKMAEHFKHFKCLLPSFWEEFLRLRPSVSDILSRDLVAPRALKKVTRVLCDTV